MATTSNSILAILGLVSMVSAHGQISSPTPRSPGTAMSAACGAQVYSNQASDSYGNVQGELQVAATQSDYNADECNIWLCKGYKYADNTANVQTYTAGQVIPITVDIRAPHTGTCNVSIVDTASNTMISNELIYFDVYASTATGVAANNTNFDITMPTNLGSQCSTAGACVIQWYWNAASIDQTYESCIDFTLGGSASGGSSVVATSSAVATSAAASSATAATSNNAAVTISSIITVTPTVTPVASSCSATTTAVVSNLAAAVVSVSSVDAATTLSTLVISATTTNAASTATSSANAIPAMPAGTTLQDLLSWLVTLLKGSS